MVRHRRSGKNKSILDYLADNRFSQDRVDEPVEQTIDSGQNSVETVEHGHGVVGDSVVDELVDMILSAKKSGVVENVEERPEVSKARAGVGESVETMSEPEIPRGGVLDTILSKGLGVEDVRCDGSGKCSDGHYIGEVFVDQYGFRRQRGFVNTTRLPVFLDWIVEEAVVQKILPRAYSVKTNRGSTALVPEDFLCELHTRYGVLLRNYDKCRNYRPVITRESRKTRKR